MQKASIFPWEWTSERERAAQLVADGQLTNDEIAARCDIARDTLQDWKRTAEFSARVQEHIASFRAKITADGLADRINQIAFIKARLAAIRGIYRARGELNESAPGDTPIQKGLQVKTLKSLRVTVKSRKKKISDSEILKLVEEYAIDTATCSEERALLQHLSILMGDWKQKTQVELTGELSVVDILRARRARREQAAQTTEQPEHKADEPGAEPQPDVEE